MDCVARMHCCIKATNYVFIKKPEYPMYVLLI